MKLEELRKELSDVMDKTFDLSQKEKTRQLTEDEKIYKSLLFNQAACLDKAIEEEKNKPYGVEYLRLKAELKQLKESNKSIEKLLPHRTRMQEINKRLSEIENEFHAKKL